MRLAWFKNTGYILTTGDEYSSYDISSIDILPYLTIPSTAVFKSSDYRAQSSYTISKNLAVDRIRESTLGYDFDATRIFDISLR